MEVEVWISVLLRIDGGMIHKVEVETRLKIRGWFNGIMNKGSIGGKGKRWWVRHVKCLSKVNSYVW